MARCGCAEQCNCVLLSGAGITISGTGTPESPYIVTNSGPAGSFVTVSDTTTIDMSISGDGSGGTPYNISGVVIPGTVVPQTEATQDIIGAALGPTLAYNDVANTFNVNPSSDPDNQLTTGSDGGAYVGNSSGLIGTVQFAYKSVDETVTNNANVQSDNEIFFDLQTGARYMMQGLLMFDSSTVADFKYGFTFPTNATVSWSSQGPGTGVSANPASVVITDSRNTDQIAHGGLGVGTANTIAVPIHGVVFGGDGGPMFLAWAQNTAEATVTTLRTDSFISLTRVG